MTGDAGERYWAGEKDKEAGQTAGAEGLGDEAADEAAVGEGPAMWNRQNDGGDGDDVTTHTKGPRRPARTKSRSWGPTTNDSRRAKFGRTYHTYRKRSAHRSKGSERVR